jgi:hypothetical protein
MHYSGTLHKASLGGYLRSSHQRMTALASLLVIVLVGVFYLSTMRSGHDWGDDFSMYILHARNIALGRDYTNTGFIYNPVYYNIRGEEPPVFPLMLAPVFKVYGLNLRAMQLEMIAIFLLACMAIFLTLKTELAPLTLTGLLAALGFNFFYWNFKENILSDFPFMLLSYGCLFLTQLLYQKNLTEKHPWLAAAVIGSTIYLTYATRVIGVVLLLGVILFDLVRVRKPTRFQVGIVGVFTALALLQERLLHHVTIEVTQVISGSTAVLRALPQNSLFQHVAILASMYPTDLVHDLVKNTSSYSGLLEVLWSNGAYDWLGITLFLVISALAVVGFGARVKNSTILEIFVVLYTLPVLAWPLPDDRYLFPVIPLYLFYALVGISRIRPYGQEWISSIATAILLGAILVCYVKGYAAFNSGPLPTGVGKETSIQLFDFVKSTPADSVFVFRKPRALTLFTERAASVYDVNQTGQDLGTYIRQIHATYVITSSIFEQDKTILDPYIEMHRDNVRLVFANSDFRVYKITNQ